MFSQFLHIYLHHKNVATMRRLMLWIIFFDLCFSGLTKSMDFTIEEMIEIFERCEAAPYTFRLFKNKMHKLNL